MGRALVLTGLLALFAAAPVAAATPVLGVKLKQCNAGASAADRSAVFQASMPREGGAVTMALRFRLYESRDGGDFARVFIPGFSDWTRSDPNVAGLVFSKRVSELVAGAAYRVIVNFAWYDAGGKAVDRARRTSKTCHEPPPTA